MGPVIRRSAAVGRASARRAPAQPKAPSPRAEAGPGNQARLRRLDRSPAVLRRDGEAEPLNGPNAPKGPSSSAFKAAYDRVSYEVWKGEAEVDKVWGFIGGSVGKLFQGKNTCATRVSYGLNYGGAPITGFDNTSSYHNDPKTEFMGKFGDDKNYNVSAPGMAVHLGRIIGPRDAHCATTDDALAYEKALPPGKGAIFAGPHHSGLIMNGYRDAYVMTDPGVMPVDVWKLT